MEKKRNKKTCKNCKERFQPERDMIEPLCSVECAIEWNRKVREKNIEKKKREVKKVVEKERREWHLKNDKLSVFEKRLQDEVNAIVRLIDYGQPCISCKEYPKKPHAGHYHSRGANKALAYHLHNEHIQCYQCNERKGGNIILYNKGLIEIYGKDYKEYVEYDLVKDHKSLNLTRWELIEFQKKASELKKELQGIDNVYDSKTRLQLRDYYNNLLGIY